MHQSFLKKGYLKLLCGTFTYISLLQTSSTSYIISKMSGRKYNIYAEQACVFLLKKKKKEVTVLLKDVTSDLNFGSMSLRSPLLGWYMVQ